MEGSAAGTASCADREKAPASDASLGSALPLPAAFGAVLLQNSLIPGFCLEEGKKEGMEAALCWEVPGRWSEEGAVVWLCG